MKVAIMTWQYPNYGTLLQAFSLQTFLEKQGCNVMIINYETNKKDVIVFKKYNIKRQAKRIKTFVIKKYKMLKMHQIDITQKKKIKKRQLLCENFITEELHMTERLEKAQLASIINRFDAFVVGSDQVWSPKYLDESFFLDYVKEKIKISYAPSFGVNELDCETSNFIRPLLEKFNAISVRELQGLRILENNLKLKGQVTLDPTLLLTKSEWNSIVANRVLHSRKNNEKYILCYFLGDNKYYWYIVEKIQKKLGISVFVIPCTEKAYKNNYSKIIGCGPFDFVNLIANSEYVITDSFHGVAFAVNMGKQFLALARFKDTEKCSENSRVLSLLEILGFQHRWINWSTEIPENIFIEDELYRKANYNLDQMRKTSIEFLKKNLIDIDVENGLKPVKI